MVSVADRVKESSTTTGTGDFTLAGAPTGFQSFDDAFAISENIYYTIVNSDGAWEVGQGHLSGSTTLVRDTVLSSSNSGSLVSFAAGTKDVFCSMPADGATVTASSPLASSGGATPAISLTGLIPADNLLLGYWRRSVRAVGRTNTNTTTAPASIDGITLASGDRVLLTAQSTGHQNGIWVFNGSGNAMTRPTDYADASTTHAFTDLMVQVYGTFGGTGTYRGALWRLTTTGTITIGTTSTSWELQSTPINDTLEIIAFPGAVATLNTTALSASRDYSAPDESGTILLDTSGVTRLFSQTDNATHAASTTESTILGTGVGSKTVAANRLRVGTKIRIILRGIYSIGVTPGTATFRITLGGSEIAISPAVAPTASTTDRACCMIAEMTVRTIGATGTVIGGGEVFLGTTANHTGTGLAATATTTIDTTGALAVDVTLDWSNTNNSWTTQQATIEIIG